MTYRALYRVFRPKSFREVIGQDHISTTLQNAITSERLAHAYLFCGPRGTGKTSSAKILSKAVNCLDLQEGEPCNQCANCTGINQENFLDVLEIDAASNRGIDEIRDIRDKVKFAPSQGKRKVYIIDEVHMLTTEAFNALLKTLEEPPEHVLFILATTEPQKIPLTILSRCQRFDFRKINTVEIKKHLADIVEEEGVDISEEALNSIARKASGGMRDAISVLDQCIAFAGEKIESQHVQMVLGTLGEEQVSILMQHILDSNYGAMLSEVNQYLEQGKDIKQMVRDLFEYSRQLLLLKVAPGEQLIQISNEMLPKAKEQAQKLQLPYLGTIINKLTEVEKEIRFASQPQILLEAALVDIIILKDNPQPVAVAPAQVVAAAQPSAGAGKPQPVVQAKPRRVVNSSEVKNHWQEILEKVKGKSIQAFAFLSEATPLGIEEGSLLIQYPTQFKFHRDKVSKPDNKGLIEKAASYVLGQPLTLKVLLEGEEQIEDFSQENSIVKQAIEVFGENIVEIKD